MKVKTNKMLLGKDIGLSLRVDTIYMTVLKDNVPVNVDEAKEFTSKEPVVTAIENFIGSNFDIQFKERS